MMTKEFRIRFAIFLSVLILFYSCKEEENQLVAYGDIFIKSIQNADTVVYGVNYYTYSWEKMTAVTVYREGDNTKISLDSIEGRYTFSYNPDSSEFTKLKPSKTKYIFNVDFDNGEQYETSDILDSTSLKPVVIKECIFVKEEQKLKIDWEGLALSDQYFVSLKNDKNEIVFQSDALGVNQTNLWIYSYSNGWYSNKQPEGGEKYRVIISAYQYEPIPSIFDLQSISIAESQSIEWVIDNELN